MKLTGKCKEDFLVWKAKYNKLSTIEALVFKHLSDVTKNAIIIDWFDESTSIEIPRLIRDTWSNSNNISYLEAIEKAIEKANLIYNDSTVKK